MNIIFLGMPMSGKTTIGKIVADKLNFIFCDTDELIAKEKKNSISEIIKKNGKAHFRNCEKKLIEKYAFINSHVISIGGGAVNMETKNIIKNYQYRVWLKCSIDKLVSRYKPNKDKRPLLYNIDNIETELKKTFAERSIFYAECANILIDSSGDCLDSLVDEVLLNINEKN